DGFQQASQRLAVASRINGSRSFAFGHVYILVPRSWSNQSVDSSATWHTEDAAHFRPGDCGQPGLHVNLHREHLRDTSAEDLGKQLVHEFAHLRGVFNEYNGALGPHAFLHQGRLSPVRCSASITGKFGHKDTGNPCKVDRVTLELEPDCDPDFDHNVAAPNPQNRRCYGRSVQSVMLEHADYKKAIDGSETDTTVNFTVVQPRGARRLVIVMDVSGSMGALPGQDEDRSPHAAAGATGRRDPVRHDQLQHFVDPPARPGSAGQRGYPQRLLENRCRPDSQRQHGNWGALAAAMELLGADMNRPSKEDTGYILLLTDGIEKPHAQIHPGTGDRRIAARTSIVVDTVAFGSQADKRLAELSAVTGGKAYFARFNSPANDLMEANVFSTPVPATFTEHVVLDESISKGCFRPSGVEYSSLNGSNYLREETAGVVSIGTEGKIEAGSWTIHGVRKSRDLPKPTNNGLSLVVTSRPTDAAPIILDGLVSPAKLVLRADTRVSVFATLSQGSELLSGAEILASVESDTGGTPRADAIRGDGVYSGFVPTQVNQVREYNVRLTASKAGEPGLHGRQVTGVDQGSLSRTPPAQDRRPARSHQPRQPGCSGRPSSSPRWEPGGMEGSLESRMLKPHTAELFNREAAGSPISVPVPPEALSGLSVTVYLAVAAENSDKILGQLSNVASVQTSLPDNLDES
uniref:CLCA domain-containing protein n=1 Tax=Macrostomum lignano TaxID=282301 RepID=A0A1I8FB37_9PLAT